MKISNKKNKQKNKKKGSNEIFHNQGSKQNDQQKDYTSLIKDKINNNNNNNSKYEENPRNTNKKNFKNDLLKISFISLLVLTVNIIYKNKTKIPIPEEILKLEDKSLNWHQKVKNFFDICSKGLNLYTKRFRKNKNPKFSLIIPVLNKRNYLLRLMTSIQNQIYDNIEIIFVDDFSDDGSIELIQNFMRKDKRIILLQHEKNKGTLITRNDGVLKARGEYILFVDPDDMILENSLQNLYDATLKYKDIDVIQFRAYKKWEKIYRWTRGYTSFDTIVEQPELSSIMFYLNGKLNQVNYFIWGKLIKRKIFLEAIEKLGEYYRNQYMTLYEDVAMLFVLLSVAKNYVYVNFYGYLYCVSKISVFENRYKYNRGNRTIKDCFLLAEFLFDFSKNTNYDKLMAVYQINRIYFEYYHVCSFVTEGFDYIFKVLEKFIKCEVLNEGDKYPVYKLKQLFEEIKNKLKNK